MQRQFDIQSLSSDRDQHIGGDSDPHLALQGVLRCAEKPLDPKMLLDPPEEEFNLPPALVRRTDAQGWNAEMIGQEDERFVGRRIPESNSAQLTGIIPGGVKIVQHHALIADQSGAAIDWPGSNALDVRVALGSSDEESAALTQCVESGEIQIAPVHHIEGADLGDQDVEYVHVVPFAVGNMDKAGNCASQVQQRMQLDRGLGRAKRGPRKQRQAQIDGGRVQRINGIVQFHAQPLNVSDTSDP